MLDQIKVKNRLEIIVSSESHCTYSYNFAISQFFGNQINYLMKFKRNTYKICLTGCIEVIIAKVEAYFSGF